MRLVTLGLLAVLVVGCNLVGLPMLELRVSNESDEEAVVTITDGYGSNAASLYTERLPAGERKTIRVEYPGPDDWILLVNDVPLTNSSSWPGDNPTLGFSIIIRPNGAVELDEL